MARIAAEHRTGGAHHPAREHPLTRAFGWLWTPRPFVLRPAWALGAVAFAVASFGMLSMDRDADGPAAVATAPTGVAAGVPTEVAAAASAEVAAARRASQIYVSFRLDAPDASSVRLAGDFTEWEPSYELHESQPGVWTVIVPLHAGVHDYAFVIDGERWTPDPLATTVDDGFGGQNSRLSLLPPELTRT